METDVSQDSILVPLLFIIYMNVILMASDNFDSITYADETNLIRPLCILNSLTDIRTVGDVDLISQKIN